MGKKSTPKPPDLSPFVDATMANAERSDAIAREQLAWAREQDTANRGILERVLAVQLPAMEEQAANAREDRARYEGTFQPIEDSLIKDFQTYGSPERMATERGRAAADVSASFDAARRNALSRLESFGVDPSQTRNAALDLGVRTQQAAVTAGAMTNATRNVEDKSRAMRADAINIGRGMPSQVANSYGQSVQAGATAQAGANQTSGTSGNLMQGANSFMQTGQAGYNGAGNMANAGFNNQMTAYNAQQQANASMMSGIGSAVGMAGMFLADGGTPAGVVDEGPTDGSGIDDQVHAKLSVGEYVIPADVVSKKGVEFFDKLLEKYHTPAAEQRQQALQIPRGRAYA